MGTLNQAQITNMLTNQWDAAKTRGAALSDMNKFLNVFQSNIKQLYHASVSIDMLQNFFMTSNSQACLARDVLDNNVQFRAKRGAVLNSEEGSNFASICCKLFERISKKRNWYGYPDLEAIFLSVERKNSNIDCLGIALKDVLRRLMKRNVVEIRHFKVRPKTGMTANQATSMLTNQFIGHIKMLGDDRPKNRNALKVAYTTFLRDLLAKNPCIENVPFDVVVQRLKGNKFLKFEPGAANITYLKHRNLSTDQHFGRLQQIRASASNLNLFNDHHMNAGKEASRNTSWGHTINKQMARKLASDHHGISITSDLDNEESKEFGLIDFGSNIEGQMAMAKITISYTAYEGGQDSISLTGCKLTANCNSNFTIGDKYNINQGKKKLDMRSGTSYQVTVYYKSKNIGKHRCLLEFQFDVKNGSGEVSIYRFIEGETKNPEVDELHSDEPYHPLKPRQSDRDPQTDIISGVPPGGMSNVPIMVQLQDYRIPSNIRYNVNSCDGSVSDFLKGILKEKPGGHKSYRERYHALLYLEELQMEVDIRMFDIENAEMRKTANLLSLEVPGLAEGKPSLVIGDRVYVRVNTSGGNQQLQQTHRRKEYQGYIHVVEKDRILLKFHPSFHSSFVNGQRHSVRFSFNRGPIRLQHRAIDIACDLHSQNRFPSLSNPEGSHIKPLLTQATVNRISCFDRKIEDNDEQLTAVKNIVAGSSRPYPYIVFGPPGTGKTVTCVEAMKQVLKLMRNSRILACTPSNSAADLILQRLIKPSPIPSNSIFRFNAFSRSINTLPDDFNIKDFCKIGNNTFEVPSLHEIESYRVVICTMATAGRLVSMGLSMEHFTHVFLDECGQAVEPETLIPLAGLINPENQFGGQVVLAGDPKQLGPVLQSPIAIENGLQESLLERVMRIASIYHRNNREMTLKDPSSLESDTDDDGDGYDDDDEDSDDDIIGRMDALERDGAHGGDEDETTENGKYDNKYITKLIKNYRSHPDILKKPNSLFYSNELISAADTCKVTRLCRWSELPTQNFPIIFHGVEGKDQREGNSPSFFNAYEAAEVVKYVRMLLDHKGLGVTPNEIGVISPYRKQVSKIRQLLKKDSNRPGMDELRIGSVEEFQGQERLIIIISTVRCSREYLKTDSKFRLGFLKNPKRFNVAITRAQALLIVVGNPFVLAEDYHWKVLLDYCIQRGGYKGCKYDDELVKDLSAKFSNMMKGP